LQAILELRFCQKQKTKQSKQLKSKQSLQRDKVKTNGRANKKVNPKP
jgi:hypothetical protein